MKRSISEWQKLISQAAHKKFPNNVTWSQYDRLHSIQEQLDDVVNAVKVEDGTLQSNDHAHQDPNHRIAALIADALILAEERGADIESDLEKVLEWFKERR